MVRVFNARGQVLAGQWFLTAMHPAWHEFTKGHGTIQIKAASLVRCANTVTPNVLTIDIGTSQLAQATSAHTTLVEIEKYNGTVEQVTAFKRPRGDGGAVRICSRVGR
ncbi:trimethylamine-N-oxide reductase precursor [Escherichia coli]|uniref:Trimethylamine-N-oxide reductase n=1 Tax=Escherichia coli TaxID=562 RepID=A0A2X1PYF9_ECOLX|nr:trimethylamine-N-oxide reductase precursor [Escherichia coli]